MYGKVTTATPEACPFCGGKLHINQYLNIKLQHISIGCIKIVLDVSFKQYLCTKCCKTTCQDIPFKQEGHFITTCFYTMIEGFLTFADMTIKGLSFALHTYPKLVKELDKARLRQKHGSMLPTHPSEHLCVDEFSMHKGHRYATVVLDWETGEILFLEEGNSGIQLIHFFEKVGWQWMKQVKSISMDMNAQYCKAVKAAYPHIEIVYDGFHIIKNFNDRILTELRRLEQNSLQDIIKKCKNKVVDLRKKSKGTPDKTASLLRQEIADLKITIKEVEARYKDLKGTRFLITSSREALLKKDTLAKKHNKELSDKYESKGLELPPGEFKRSTRNVQRLDEVLRTNENLSVAFFLGDQLKASLDSVDETEMRDGLKQWLELADSYRQEIPMLESFNKMIRTRMDGIVARVKFPISNGPLEGVNNMIKSCRRQAFGYRDNEYFFLKIWDRSRRYPKNRSINEVLKERKKAHEACKKKYHAYKKSHKFIS